MASENFINVGVTGPPIEVTVEEVEEACKILKNNKAPRLGGIPGVLVCTSQEG